MTPKRKKVTEGILKRIGAIIPDDDTNVKILREKFDAMSDKEFEDYIRKLKPIKTAEDIVNREWLPFYVPNLSKHRVSIARNYRLARDMGRSLEHRLVMTDPSTGLQYVTPHSYPVLDLPVRRQAQTVAKKR